MEMLEMDTMDTTVKEKTRRGRNKNEGIKKERVQFDFSPSALHILDELKEKTGAATRAETVRDALKVYEWFIRTAEPESIITVANKNGDLLSKLQGFVLGAKQPKQETPL